MEIGLFGELGIEYILRAREAKPSAPRRSASAVACYHRDGWSERFNPVGYVFSTTWQVGCLAQRAASEVWTAAAT